MPKLRRSMARLAIALLRLGLSLRVVASSRLSVPIREDHITKPGEAVS